MFVLPGVCICVMASRVVDRSRFDAFVALLAEALGHADRRWPLEAYVTGLLLPGERKSVEPIAARVDPAGVGRAHQALHHFVAVAPWDERVVLRVAREYALELLERQAPLAGWVIARDERAGRLALVPAEGVGDGP